MVIDNDGWDDSLPGWHDNLRMVEIELADGSRVSGKLDYEDCTPGPEEWPIYFLVTASGERINMVESERFRFLDEVPSGPCRSIDSP